MNNWYEIWYLLENNMKNEKRYIIGKFQMTEPNIVNIDMLVKDWNYLWFIAQWGNEPDVQRFRLVKYIRYDSQYTDFKSTISNEQANELITKLGLVREQSIFASGSSWRRKSDIELLEQKRLKKYNKIK